MQVAVFVGCFDRFSDSEVGFGFFVGGEVLLLVAGSGFQDDPLDVMGFQHGMGDGADFHGNVVAVLLNDRNMLLLGSVLSIGDKFDGAFLGFVDLDGVVQLVECHSGILKYVILS